MARQRPGGECDGGTETDRDDRREGIIGAAADRVDLGEVEHVLAAVEIDDDIARRILGRDEDEGVVVLASDEPVRSATTLERIVVVAPVQGVGSAESAELKLNFPDKDKLLVDLL
jgi:hypothetical protein